MVLPQESQATRSFTWRSKISKRGSLVCPRRNQRYVYESGFEHDYMLICLTSDDVEDYIEQPEAVRYRLPDGRWEKHTFDGLLILKDSGRRIAVDVKPFDEVERSRIEETQRLIREQVGKAFADAYVVRTEEHIHPDDVFDAELLMHAYDLPCSVSDEVIAKLSVNLRGWCRVRDLVAAAGIGGNGFNAVVRLIGSEMLEVRDKARISYECFVRRTPRLSFE